MYTKKKTTILSKIRTLKRIKKHIPKTGNKLIYYLDDNRREFAQGKIISDNIIEQYIFNDKKLNCICENIYKQHLNNECKCNQMKTYSSQGKSGAAIHSIICKTPLKLKNKINNIDQKQILKVVPLSNYYMKLRTETDNYIFIELDGFTIQTLINTYVYKELPYNTVNILHSGVCNNIYNRDIKGKYHGYNLMEEANLGSGKDFLNNIINGNYDKDFKIINEEKRYLMVCNCLLQIVLIIGHLQSCNLEFFHGDYKPDNVFVKKCALDKTKIFKFNVFGKIMKIKNMGFSVLIADFDRSSMTLHSNLKDKKKYRIIPPILFKAFLTSYVNKIIKNYGDVDPDVYQEDIKIDKLFISNFIPKKIDPTITILRSAGVKLYRDFDLYTFFIRLIETDMIRNYIIKYKMNTTIMSFMTDNFRKILFDMPTRVLSLNESALIVINILKTIKEPLPVIFKRDYLNILTNLNYKLFKI
jgi:hypothetical protein